MKPGMEDILDNQKKAFETWKDWSDQWMKNFPGMTPPSSGADFFVPWMDVQRKWMDETMKMGNQKSSLENAPKQWKEWMEVQTQMSDKWMEFYRKQAQQMGDVPGAFNPGKTFFPEMGMKPWQNWMEESNKWIRQNILDKIPANMKPHFSNFTAIYDEMGKYWEPIQRMIQFGTYSKETTDQFFGPDAYRRVVSLFLGFKPVDNTAKLVEDVNTFFEDFIGGMQKTTPGTHEFMNSWISFFRDWGRQTGHPGLQAVAEVTHLVDKGINSFYHVAGPSEELAMAKLLKDIQFTYTAFLLKSSEMQHVLLDAGQFALPDTLKDFYDEFQKTQKMPNYTEFFNRYANNLEDYILEVLESDEYSKLQADVSKVGITVKSKMDELIELAFNDFPFLMKSFADEVAQENKSLRRKVRDLENRLYAIESTILGGSAVPKEEASKEVNSEAKTTTRKAVKK
ncbi:MAG: hypothetical protein IPJ00_19650 [Saprospirales bacterium]|nr:hypothetical protein [Saprospirales bacterium]